MSNTTPQVPPMSVDCFFLDSGAHSIYTREVINKNGASGYAYYETEEFYAYCDSYARFVKKFGWAIDYYANIDAIFNPEITWKVQQYLEKEHGLRPVPVIHYGTPLKWIQHYMDRGYEFLGIGGLGQEVTKDEYYGWADQVYGMICPESNRRLPLVRTHGFAMTSWELMFRYPWWSVDSASWIKAAAYGMIYVPHRRGGHYVFTERPYSITVSARSPNAQVKGKHINTLTSEERRIVEGWLEKLGVPLGKVDAEGNEVVRGVVSHHKPRAEANLKYFTEMCRALPPWPRPFHARPRSNFGLF